MQRQQPSFLALDDETKDWPVTKVKNTVTFNWVLTAPYRTGTWDYYIGDTRIARFDSQGEAPTSPVIHTVDLNGGRAAEGAGGLEHRRHGKRLLLMRRPAEVGEP